ncbi:MAG: HAD-IIA family hydrolase [Acidobacteria bacterium]|nr:HAD-IIA family hydrolase [Acidobacteriota bacterium]
MTSPDRWFKAYAFDLDGTIYLGDRLLPGAADAIRGLKSFSRVAYVTNKPLQTPADYASKLTRLGIETSPRDVISSTDALIRFLALRAPSARLFVIGEPPLVRLLQLAGHPIAGDPDGVEFVVVAFDRGFSYRKLQVAFDAVSRGARLVATNPDPFCPTPEGGLPDCAAMLAAVEAATGVRAEAVVGKPSPHMAAAVLDRLGVPAGSVLMTGDRLATDIRMAKLAGMSSALILTGCPTLEEVQDSPDRPDYVLNSLAELLPAGMPDRPTYSTPILKR